MGRYSVGADRGGSGVRGRRSVRVMAYASCGALLLAGCASMPDSGDLRQVESTPRQDSQVRVYAIPPRPGASADEIVRGFLEALTSDDANYETAGKYLTDGARKTWDPYDSTTVLGDAPEPVTVPTDTKDGTRDVRFRLNGSKIAGVDERHAYEPAAGTYNESVRLTKLKNKQWRIDALPQGVVMGSSDFQRNYVSVNKYYYASNGISGAGRPLATVADPVYVRAQVDPMTQIVRALLRGPTKWLDPEVTSSFPTGTDLKSADTSLSTDDRNRVTVPLNGQADHVGNAVCERMAAQVLLTLTNLTPTGVDEVELQRSDGSQLCVQTKGQAAESPRTVRAGSRRTSTSSTTSSGLYGWTAATATRSPNRCPGRSVRASRSCGRPRCHGTRPPRPGCPPTAGTCTSGRWCPAVHSANRCCAARAAHRPTG